MREVTEREPEDVRIWLARITDDGVPFADIEVMVLDPPPGEVPRDTLEHAVEKEWGAASAAGLGQPAS